MTAMIPGIDLTKYKLSGEWELTGEQKLYIIVFVLQLSHSFKETICENWTTVPEVNLRSDDKCDILDTLYKSFNDVVH